MNFQCTAHPGNVSNGMTHKNINRSRTKNKQITKTASCVCKNVAQNQEGKKTFEIRINIVKGTVLL